MARVYERRFPIGFDKNRLPGMYLHDALKDNLNVGKLSVRRDWDQVYLVDGVEGGGKSVLAQQIGYFCDPTLTIDRIVFDAKSFREAVKNATKYQCVIFDEAYGGLSSRQAMSEVNKTIVAMLTRIRRKNLFLIIVLPSFFDVDKYIALWRSRMLVHVLADKFRRGFFKFYNYHKKKNMYVLGKKFYSYRSVKPNFMGDFRDFYPVGREAYKTKKNECSDEADFEEVRTEASIVMETKKEILKNIMTYQEKLKLTKTLIGGFLGVTRSTVAKWSKDKRPIV